KVQKHWQEQTQTYSRAMRAVAESIRGCVATVEETAGKEGGIDPNQVKKFKDDVEKAAKLVDAMVGHFRADAFAKPLTILTTKSSGDKSEKEKLHRQKLAAREEALRIMRQLRTDVLNHPLLRLLASKENPFEQNQVMAALAYIRASLKRIEIETLIGVE